ncbi:v-type c subunit family [Fusarium circinatum]|uniref:V-type c subunit family n=1 Tax=Fusarium circinatum TaxID=48490 RepID=A0A8H5WFN4_FUSCI|nr:v-type c subunit family [Fusarium circinatum]
MALRLALRAPRSRLYNCLSITTRRVFSTSKQSDYFTVELSPKIKVSSVTRSIVDFADPPKDPSRLLQTVRSQINITNPSRHDAAVILATPQYAQWLSKNEFLSEFVDMLSGSDGTGEFHTLAAVVDHIAPPVPSNKPIQGISILRGNLDGILPGLWTEAPPKEWSDGGKVSALTMDLGSPHITIPLTNTTFQNHRTSTLIISRYDLSAGSPKLIEQTDKKHLQKVTIPVQKRLSSINDLDIWAPLVPLTQPRVVTESFGNIVRRVDIEDESVPASTELEPAVDELHASKSDLVQSPMGIWAMITPPTFVQSGGSSPYVNPDPEATFTDGQSITELTAVTSDQLGILYRQGGRLYQVLSGGGGWGAKKGLLSLDPEQTHFVVSEEEEMQRFIQAMEGGNFVPVSSKIQFFASTDASASELVGNKETETGVVFGTASKVEVETDMSPSQPEALLLENHFGALSNVGIFVTSSDASMFSKPGFNNDWKLNVPNSRIYVI